MIIESGFDLFVLLLRDRTLSHLRLVAFDADLRPVSERTVLTEFSGEMDRFAVTAIESALDQIDADAEVRFVALGHGVPDTGRHQQMLGEGIHDELDAMLRRRGLTSLGVVVWDGEYWASSGPVHGFESYLIGEDLPRVLIIPGPHPMFTCECSYCEKRYSALRRARSTESCTISE